MMLFLKNALFTIFAPGTVSVLIPYLLLRSGLPQLHVELGPARYAGISLIAAGAALYAWTVWEFATRGRGTPLPLDAPKTLVVRGPYRVVRNPMYAGVLAVILGQAVWFEAALLAIYAALALLVVHTFILLYEEPTLRRLFGESYAEYCRTVPRWIPRRQPFSRVSWRVTEQHDCGGLSNDERSHPAEPDAQHRSIG